MIIENLKKENIKAVNELFNKYAEVEFPHKKMNEQLFTQSFIDNTEKVTKINLVAREGSKVIAFANGCVQESTFTGYVTFILVESEYRRNGIAKTLLDELEKQLGEIKELEKFEITFFNPINLTWIIPGTKNHDHPNAPGVELGSNAHLFFKNNGYIDTAYQNSFYLPIKTFEIKDEVQKKIDALPEHELSICYYDKNKHYGMEELFDNLENPLWKEEILGNINRADGGDPVIIAEHNGKAVGFTGPLRTQESGRGYFAGIGVHSEYRKYGLGKSLFSMLCKCHKDIGSDFMTLFTGETNPARYIYQSAGFKIVKSWADMKKDIKK